MSGAPIKRRGRTVTIDVLRYKKAADNGTLSDRDRQTAERILPGLTDIVKPRKPGNECPLGKCDGSGMRDVYALHTSVSTPGGGAYVQKEPLTRAQYEALAAKLTDSKTQKLLTGSKMCECRSAAK